VANTGGFDTAHAAARYATESCSLNHVLNSISTLFRSHSLNRLGTASMACRAYDRAAIKFRGVDADINFNLSDYEDDMKQVRKN
jgi:hypothetical protein